MLRLVLTKARGLAVLAIGAAVLSGVSTTLILALLNWAIQHVGQDLGVVAGVFFLTCLFAYVFRITSDLVLIRLGQEVLYAMRMSLSRSILELKLRRLEEIGPHRIISTLADDIPVISIGIMLLPSLCFQLATLAACLIYLAVLSPPVFLISAVFIAIGALAYQYPAFQATRYFRKARATNDELYDAYHALTHGLKELKINRPRRSAFLDRTLEPTADRFRYENIKGLGIHAFAANSGQILAFTILGLLVIVLPSRLDVDTAVLVGYALVLLHILTPLQDTMNAMPRLQRSNIALQNITRLGLDLAGDGHREDLDAATPLRPSWHRLEMRGAVHSFRREGEPDDFVLGPIDLELRPGELVFLVGGNGSGKTTLAKMLVGLYEPSEGQLLLDGRPVLPEDRDRYRQLFSTVFADFYLFEQLLGVEPSQLDAQAREYLARLQLSHKVRIENGVLSTTAVSQGQRKRLALLTAYLEDRPIYLFDEWAADQDPSFKGIFYNVLLPDLKRRGKTVVVITHDDAYFAVADRVIVLDYGRIVSTHTAGSASVSFA